MLNIVYFSNVTGNTHRFIEKLGWENSHRIPIKMEEMEEVSHPYVLITPSYGSKTTGYVPPQVKRFLANKNNVEKCVGVIGSGNINFGIEYAHAADMISKNFHLPILYRFELAGTDVDVNNVTKGLQKVEQHLQTSSSHIRIETQKETK